MPLNVMLCCNDDRNGDFLGRAEAIEVEDIQLEGGSVTCNWISRRLSRAKSYEGDSTLRIGRLFIPCLEYRTWVGNCCWDCAKIRAVHALRIINYLAKARWHAVEAEYRIFDAINERRVVTADEWMRYSIDLVCAATPVQRETTERLVL